MLSSLVPRKTCTCDMCVACGGTATRRPQFVSSWQSRSVLVTCHTLLSIVASLSADAAARSLATRRRPFVCLYLKCPKFLDEYCNRIQRTVTAVHCNCLPLCGGTATVFLILQHLMKVSVKRPAPAGLPPVAVCTQTILIVTQPSHSIVRTLTPPAVTLTKATSSIQCSNSRPAHRSAACSNSRPAHRIVLPSSLSSALPCRQSTFIRRTSGHCLETSSAVNTPPRNNKCCACHYMSLHVTTPL